MKIVLNIITFLLLLAYYANAQIIVNDDKEVRVFEKSEIYFDTSNQETIDTLMKKPELFQAYHKEYINNWLQNQYPVWIKFTLVNPTSQALYRTLSFDEYFIEHIELYTTKDNIVLNKKLAGYKHREKFNGIIQPHFELELPPNTETTYYIKVFIPSYSTSFKATLSTYESFIYEDIKYHLMLALFICTLVTVCIYNFILFFLAKDSIYFYYALYILGILAAKRVHFLITLYIFPLEDPSVVQQEIDLIIYGTNFTTLSMILFTQHFLQTKSYPKLHTSLNFFIGLILVHSVVTSPTFLTYNEIAVFYLFIMLYLFFIGFYALYKKNKNALYFIFGWGLSVFAWISITLNSMNIWNFRYDFYYLTEILIVIEVFLFSYVIAKNIKELNNDKMQLSQKLVEQKENENIRLEKEVNEKTAHLNEELKTNTILLQELNHRVKNNMQFITSLYALKLGNNVDVQEKLQDVERKVLAMSQVHQMLYTQKSLNYIQADDYFETIIKNIQESFNQENIKFIYNIQITLNIEEAIYCGLILNELVTNAMKYAFAQNKGEIKITLSEDKDYKYLKVQDNGKGIQKDSKSGFGQMLIETLATQQLGGKVFTDTTNGTTVEISFQKI